MPEVELIGTLATGVTTAPIQELFAEYLNKQVWKTMQIFTDISFIHSASNNGNQMSLTGIKIPKLFFVSTYYLPATEYS